MDDLIPEVSDGTIIPGNADLTEAAKLDRVNRYFQPYHAAIEQVIESRRQGTVFLSIHSMTDRLKGVFRPWPISLSSYQDRSLVEPLLKSMHEFSIGDNEPYDLDPKVDYSTPFHAIRRGLPHLQVEFRQDEIGTEKGQKLWAGRFGDAIAKSRALAKPGLLNSPRQLLAGCRSFGNGGNRCLGFLHMFLGGLLGSRGGGSRSSSILGFLGYRSSHQERHRNYRQKGRANQFVHFISPLS